MLTNRERITALKCNLKNHDWTVLQQFRLEKEDGEALLGLLNKVDERLIWDQKTEQ